MNRKLVLLVFSIVFLGALVSAGSTYSFKVNTTSEWNNGFNVGNTTVESGNLTTPQEFIKFTDDWSNYQTASGWDAPGDKIIQSESSAWSTRDFKSSQEQDDYIGGVFDGNELVGEQSHYFYDGGETDMIGSGLLYDAPAEAITDEWYYEFSTLNGGSKSVTFICSDSVEHTVEWGYDGSNPYVKFDGVKDTFADGDTFSYAQLDGHDSDCVDVADNEEVEINNIGDDVYWRIGASQDDIAHIVDGKINMQSEPVDEQILLPSGEQNVINVSLSESAQDVVTMYNPDNGFTGETGVAVNGDGLKDNNIYAYTIDADGTATEECGWGGVVAEAKHHVLASVKADLSFGDGSTDMITVDDDNSFTLLDPAGSGGDNCNTKGLSNPTSKQLTGVASDLRDVDQDGNAELVFTAISGGSGADANGYIHHADFDINGLSDVHNTGIQTFEGDVGALSDWNADNKPEIPYRDTNGNVKLAVFDDSFSSSGEYKSKNYTEDIVFEGSNLSIGYEPYDSSADLDYSWRERGFNGLLPSTQSVYTVDSFAEDIMYSSVTMRFNYSNAGALSNKLQVYNWTLWGNRFEEVGEWNSSTISPQDPTPSSLGSYVVPTGLSNDSYDPDTANFNDNHKVEFYVASKDSGSSGGWSSFYSNLDNVPVGDELALKVKIINRDDEGDPQLGNTSQVDWAELDYVFPNVPVEIDHFNESEDVEYVQAGEDLIVKTRIYDADGTSDIVQPEVNVTWPNSTETQLGSGSLLSTNDGYRYEFSGNSDATSSNLGSGSIEVIGQDSHEIVNSTNFYVNDTRPPVYKNLAQTSDEVEESDNNTLSLDVKDSIEVDKVVFWTNKSGGYSKLRTKDVSIGSSYQTVQTDYDTTNEGAGNTIDWKAEIVDTGGNSKNTSVKSFDIAELILIENVEVRYRKVGSGDVEKNMNLTLDSNKNISDHESVAGADTIAFKDGYWSLENFTLPFSENLTVNNTDGVKTTHEVDYNISVKNVRGHDDNSNPTYQEKNKTIAVENNGDTIDVNVSCVNNNYGTNVSSSVDTVFEVLGGINYSHACRWSGDWVDESYKDADPTVSSVRISKLLAVDRNVTLTNNEAVKFPHVNMSGYAEPHNTCSVSNNEILSVSANGFNSGLVDFECDIGDEGSPTTEISGSDYNHTTKLNVSSDLAENITIIWRENKSSIVDWTSRDSGSGTAYVKGTSDSILLVESGSYVEVRVPDDAFSSSLHQGQKRASITYTVGASSSDGGGAGGSGDPIIITKNVTGEYNWSVSAPRTRGQQFFNIIGWSGRDLGNAPTRIEARNLDNKNFTLEARCVANDRSCEFIELSKDNFTLNTLDKREQIVKIEGVIPEDMPEDGYRFNIVFKDPAGQEIETNFRIQKNFVQSIVIRFVSKIFSILFIPVFLGSLLLWILMAFSLNLAHELDLLDERLDYTRARLLITVGFFILAFVVI